MPNSFPNIKMSPMELLFFAEKIVKKATRMVPVGHGNDSSEVTRLDRKAAKEIITDYFLVNPQKNIFK